MRDVTPKLWVAGMLAGGGLAAMAANLLFAAKLSAADYGTLVLFQSWSGLVVGLSPMGLDVLIVRGELAIGIRERVEVAGIGTFVSLVIVGILASIYDELGIVAALLLISIGGTWVWARGRAAAWQRQLRFIRSQAVTQIPWFVFAAMALVPITIGWSFGAVGLAMGYVAAALLSMVPSADASDETTPGVTKEHWGQGLLLTGISGSMLVLSYGERLVVGGVASVEDLATFGLASTLIAAPFKLIGAGVAYTTLPHVSQVGRLGQWPKVLVREFVTAAVLVASLTAFLIWAVPIVVEAFYGGRYQIGGGLTWAFVAVGATRMLYSVLSAGLVGIGGARSLSVFLWLGWIVTGLTVVGAVLASRLDLTNVVWAFAVGWFVRTSATGWVLFGEWSEVHGKWGKA